MTRMRSLLSAGLTFALVLTSSQLEAQLCGGVPFNRDQTVVMASAGFPDNANTFGIEGRRKTSNAIVLAGGYSITTIDEDAAGGEDIPSQHTIAAQGAYEFQLQSAESGPQLGICPNVGFGYTKWDELSMVSIPLGIGVGTAFEIGQGTALLAPYASPSIVFAKAEVEDVESDWENDFGITAGANLVVSNLIFGGSFTKVGDADGTFGVQAGLIF